MTADGHQRLRRWAPAIFGIGFFALMAALYMTGQTGLYRGVIIAWGIDPFAYPFLDTETYLSAARCLRQGVDVYVDNTCDPLRRVFDYSPLWMVLSLLPMTPAWLSPFGFACDAAFLASLLLLPAGRRPRDTVLIVLGVISSATLFAVERGNNDLVLFTLAACAAVLIGRSPALRWLGYGLALLAGLLKYYPMTLMLIATREKLKPFLAVGIVATALTALFALVTWHDLTRAVADLPTGSFFGNMFGSITIGGGLARKLHWNWETAQAIRIAMSAAAFAAGLWFAMRPRLTRTLASISELERSFLLIGGLLLISCFFSAQNIGYRAVHLILVLPPLTALAFREGRRLFWIAAIVAVLLLWGEAWRMGGLALGEHLGGHKGMKYAYYATWIAREGMWWWMISLLIGCVANLLVNSETARAVRGWWTPSPAPR